MSTLRLTAGRTLGLIGLAGALVGLLSLPPWPWLAVWIAALVLGGWIAWRNPVWLDGLGRSTVYGIAWALLLEMVWEAVIDAPAFAGDQAAWAVITLAKGLTWATALAGIAIDLRQLWRRRIWRDPVGRDVLIVLAVAVAMRLLTAVSWRFHVQSDGIGYVQLADGFVNLHLQSNLQYAFFQFLLSFALRSTQYLGAWAEVAHLAIFLTLSLAVPLLSYDILRRVRGRRAGMVGGLLAALSLTQIAWAHHTLTEGVGLLLMIVLVWALTVAATRDPEQRVGRPWFWPGPR